ncbi:CCAAT-binding factor complex subunit HapC [Cryptosporidium felis]|nr:CCAAT-binding factor complex subunit HapC [Cryptosporidium felis]
MITFQVNEEICNKPKVCNLNDLDITNNIDDDNDNCEDFDLFENNETSDLSLPINNIGRVLKLSIPDTAKIQKESIILMQRILRDFIVSRSSRADRVCTGNKRRILNGEDIIDTLSSFDFGSYSNALKNYMNFKKRVKYSKDYDLREDSDFHPEFDSNYIKNSISDLEIVDNTHLDSQIGFKKGGLQNGGSNYNMCSKYELIVQNNGDNSGSTIDYILFNPHICDSGNYFNKEPPHEFQINKNPEIYDHLDQILTQPMNSSNYLEGSRFSQESIQLNKFGKRVKYEQNAFLNKICDNSHEIINKFTDYGQLGTVKNNFHCKKLKLISDPNLYDANTNDFPQRRMFP